jgi:peptide-methionine (R)-S-oxide reductase
MSCAIRPAKLASTENQKKSIAELWNLRKFALYEEAGEDLSIYHKVSCKPITVKAENDMELISDLFTQGEKYLDHWVEGVYQCSRCNAPLFSSADKWLGPCVWPSFRRPYYDNEESVDLIEVSPYAAYKCTVKECYCKSCDLFLGHGFEDGKEKGDSSPDAHWRF